jgi:DNA-binding transcriptional regulator YdaS (Cro superfamily)
MQHFLNELARDEETFTSAANYIATALGIRPQVARDLVDQSPQGKQRQQEEFDRLAAHTISIRQAARVLGWPEETVLRQLGKILGIEIENPQTVYNELLEGKITVSEAANRLHLPDEEIEVWLEIRLPTLQKLLQGTITFPEVVKEIARKLEGKVSEQEIRKWLDLTPQGKQRKQQAMGTLVNEQITPAQMNRIMGWRPGSAEAILSLEPGQREKKRERDERLEKKTEEVIGYLVEGLVNVKEAAVLLDGSRTEGSIKKLLTQQPEVQAYMLQVLQRVENGGEPISRAKAAELLGVSQRTIDTRLVQAELAPAEDEKISILDWVISGEGSVQEALTMLRTGPTGLGEMLHQRCRERGMEWSEVEPKIRKSDEPTQLKTDVTNSKHTKIRRGI